MIWMKYTIHSIAYPSKEFRCASILPLGTEKMKQYFNMDVMAHRQRSIAFFQTWFANYFHWVSIKCQLVFYILYILFFVLTVDVLYWTYRFHFIEASSSRLWLINALGPLIALRDNANLLLCVCANVMKVFFLYCCCGCGCCCCWMCPFRKNMGK